MARPTVPFLIPPLVLAVGCAEPEPPTAPTSEPTLGIKPVHALSFAS